jgi:hypothetical protein
LSMGFGAFLAATITISYAAVVLRNVPSAEPERNRLSVPYWKRPTKW